MNRVRAKNQPLSSEAEAKKKLILYVYEYLVHCNANNAADQFLAAVDWDNVNERIQPSEKPGFLVNWWCVFWDLYCAAPDRRMSQPGIESSQEAKAIMSFRDVMSPSCSNTSPPQQPPQPFMSGPPMNMNHMGPGGPPGYGGPPPPGPPPPGPPPPQHMRQMQPRMQPPPPTGPGGNIQPPYMMSNSPRYSHPPPHQSHMTPPAVSMYPEAGPSPGVSRMASSHSASPLHRMTPTPQMSGPPQGGGVGQQVSGKMMSMQGPPPGHPMQQPQPGNWQLNSQVNYNNVNSPAPPQSGGYMMTPQGVPGGGGGGGGPAGDNPLRDPMSGGPMMNDNGMMDIKNEGAPNGDSAPLSAEDNYSIPIYQDTDQSDASEIMKHKQSLQDQTTKQEFTDNYYQ